MCYIRKKLVQFLRRIIQPDSGELGHALLAVHSLDISLRHDRIHNKKKGNPC